MISEGRFISSDVSTLSVTNTEQLMMDHGQDTMIQQGATGNKHSAW